MTSQPRSGARGSPAGNDAGLADAPAPMRAVATFEVFYQQELRAVIGLAYALSGSRTAAEDLAQEAFLAAHKSWDRIGAYDNPGAWVRRVVANKSVSMFRRRVREAKALARLRFADAVMPAMPVDDDAFWAAVRSLPKRQAQAIALHYLEDRSVVDIAEILECAEGTVKVHLRNGRLRLAETLGLEIGGAEW